MKKLLLALVGVASTAMVSADSEAVLPSGYAKVNYEMRHIEKGRLVAKNAITFKSKFVGEFDGFLPYFRVDTVSGMGHQNTSRFENDVFAFPRMKHDYVKLSLGSGYDFENFRVDLGASYVYNYGLSKNFKLDMLTRGATSSLKTKRNAVECFAGVQCDCLFSPSLYARYNFMERDFNIEARTHYVLDLSDKIYSGVNFELDTMIGFDKLGRPYGVKDKELVRAIFGSKRDSFYYGVTADIVWHFHDHAGLNVGIDLGGNFAKKNAVTNRYDLQMLTKKKIHRCFCGVHAGLECAF